MNIFETKKEVIKNLIPQTHERLNKYINDSGCNFRVLSAIAEISCRQCLSCEDILDIYYIVLKTVIEEKTVIKKDCTVQKPEELINFVFKFLGSEHTALNVGYMKDGIPVTWQNKVTQNYDFTVIKLYQQDMRKRHFDLGDFDVNLLWDPYPGSRSTQLWNIKDAYLYKVL